MTKSHRIPELAGTITLMEQIDEVIEKQGRWPIEQEDEAGRLTDAHIPQRD